VPIEPETTAQTYQCGWTNLPVRDRHCDRSIPGAAVTAAWEASHTPGFATKTGYFDCSYEGELWLAFDRGDGDIGRVLCPTHRAQRGTPQ